MATISSEQVVKHHKGQTVIAALPEGSLPEKLEAEKYILGAVLINNAHFVTARMTLNPEDFALEKHKRIWSRMTDLHERGEAIDRVTLANELMRCGQLESVDGLSYIVSLDNHMPDLPNIEEWAAIVLEAARARSTIFACQNAIERCASGESSLDILGQLGQETVNLAVDRNKSNTLSFADIILSAPRGYMSFLDPEHRVKGLLTGFDKFDEMTGGLRGKELIILAARPAMGKSALALDIGKNIAKTYNKHVLFASLEMSKESLFDRALCSEARIDLQRYRAGLIYDQRVKQKLYEALQTLSNIPLHLNDQIRSVFDLHNAALRLQNTEQGLGAIVVDYLQLMEGKGRFENRVQEISSLSRGLKLMSNELNVPVIALSQLSRDPEKRGGDHRPMLSDLRESGSIEQDADMVGFIYREEVYRPDKDALKGIAELILAKQRNGPTGTAKLAFLSRLAKFENLAYQPESEHQESYN